MIRARSRGCLERKAQAILEQLKKDQTRKGLKEIVLNKLIENTEFEYSDRDAIEEVMAKIKKFVNEDKWSKTVKLVSEFKQLKQREEESNKEFIIRFGMMEVKMKKVVINLIATWMTLELMQKSKLNDMQRHNLLSSLDQNDEVNILKNIKKS